MDLIGILLTLCISRLVTACYICYILFSRLYSWRRIRLKKYPIIGYLTVIINQGALIFFMVVNGVATTDTIQIPYQLLLVSSLLIGGFYPITQIYQHHQDQQDNVTTLSMMLGKRGTFIFCLLLYITAFSILFFYFYQHDELQHFFILQLFFIPVIIYFLGWFIRVWKDEAEADFKQTMRMNWIASICTNAAFITLLIIKHFG
jgi:1,4-dihydroxy-2-naphthoate octaprenyltransferase